MTKNQSGAAAAIPQQKFTESRIGLWLGSAEETNRPPENLTAEELAQAKAQLHAWRAAANKPSRAEDLLKELRALVSIYGEWPRTDDDRLAETNLWLTAFFGEDARMRKISFSVDQLQRAFAAHVATPRSGEFMPKPSQILEHAFRLKGVDNSRIATLEELLNNPDGPWVFKGRWRTRFAWEAEAQFERDPKTPPTPDEKAKVAEVAEAARKRLGPPVTESPFTSKHGDPGPFPPDPETIPLDLPPETSSEEILAGLKVEEVVSPTPDG